MVVSNIFYFHPDPWGNDPTLTSIFFRWVETTNQKTWMLLGDLSGGIRLASTSYKWSYNHCKWPKINIILNFT